MSTKSTKTSVKIQPEVNANAIKVVLDGNVTMVSEEVFATTEEPEQLTAKCQAAKKIQVRQLANLQKWAIAQRLNFLLFIMNLREIVNFSHSDKTAAVPTLLDALVQACPDVKDCAAYERWLRPVFGNDCPRVASSG